MFYERLKEVCSIRHTTPSAMLKALELSTGSLARWKRGTIPSGKTLDRLADFLGVSADYLLGKTENIEAGQTIHISHIKNLEPLPETKKIPLLGDIACGEPILAEENLDGYIEVDKSIKADFALRCRGDSMINARILDGDIVYIRHQPTVENGQIAAVLIDNEATLKRIYKNGDTLILQPENPAYSPMVYTPECRAEVKILGLAVAFTSTIK